MIIIIQAAAAYSLRGEQFPTERTGAAKYLEGRGDGLRVAVGGVTAHQGVEHHLRAGLLISLNSVVHRLKIIQLKTFSYQKY